MGLNPGGVTKYAKCRILEGVGVSPMPFVIMGCLLVLPVLNPFQGYERQCPYEYRDDVGVYDFRYGA